MTDGKSNNRRENNIFDVICYCDDQDRPEYGIQTVNDVICKLATDKRRRQQRHDEKYIKLKLIGCLLINVRF